MDKKNFMVKYSDLMDAAAFADACGPIDDVEIFEDAKGEPATKPAISIASPAAAL
jgi:hypothetical protein